MYTHLKIPMIWIRIKYEYYQKIKGGVGLVNHPVQYNLQHCCTITRTVKEYNIITYR